MRVAANLGDNIGGGRRAADCFPSRDGSPRALLPAVVPSASQPNTAATAGNRTSAALLAQLVATVENMPTSRARRRADPQAGVNLYRWIAKLPLAPRRQAGRIF
jgi:hypothetical protein